MSSGIRSSSSCTRTHAHAATNQSAPRMPVGYGHVGWAALFPTQHGIPRGMASHTAWYPTRHGIPHSTVSAPDRLQNRALIDRPSRRASCARSPEGLRHAPCGTCHVARCVRCASPHVVRRPPVRVVTAWPPRCRRARRRSAPGGPHGVCWWVGQAKRRAVSAASGVGGSRAGERCGPLLVSTSRHPAPLPSASPLPSLKGYSQRCSLSNPIRPGHDGYCPRLLEVVYLVSTAGSAFTGCVGSTPQSLLAKQCRPCTTVRPVRQHCYYRQHCHCASWGGWRDGWLCPICLS
jgi:hypothetical protein